MGGCNRTVVLDTVCRFLAVVVWGRANMGMFLRFFYNLEIGRTTIGTALGSYIGILII